MKFKKRNDGFTLVELVVVIAILGILAGVGTVGYSGYITSANKAADKQLISDIKYAIELENITTPFTGADAVILSADGATVAGQSDAADADDVWLTAALKQAFGNDLSALQLKYGKWGKGIDTSKEVIELFNGLQSATTGDEAVIKDVVNGTVIPSFAGDVDELFELIRDTAIDVNGSTSATSSGASLVAGAAEKTMNVKDGGGIDKFVTTWANNAWDGTQVFDGLQYGSDEDIKGLTAAEMELAIANAAVIKARNTSIATWMRDNGYGSYYAGTANYGGNIPRDLVADVMAAASNNETFLKLAETFDVDTTDTSAVQKFRDDMGAVSTGYFGGDADSQAAKDAKAYYTMMYTVDKTKPEDDEAKDLDDDTYWGMMAPAVSMYGSIAQGGQDTLDELVAMMGSITDDDLAENQVALFVSNVGGQLKIMVSPTSAEAGA